MNNNELLQKDDKLYRVLAEKDDCVLVIDCIKQTMPKWISTEVLSAFSPCTEEILQEQTDVMLQKYETVSGKNKEIMHKRYTMIAGILPFLAEEQQRNTVIARTAKEREISKQTLRNYLCKYLAYQNITVLAPVTKQERNLTADEKNMRWALNKYYYNSRKYSLTTVYTLLLKEKYCDGKGTLLPQHPSIHQFRYFFRKTKNMQSYYISRDGLKSYQRNNRPLLGDGVQQFATHIGVGMLDATICDIYLIDDAGKLVGRPILTACIDAYSSLCCGYSLTWEGGVYSLRSLMLNVIADKVEHCRKYGILIDMNDWNCKQIPATLTTDRGTEYTAQNFEQLAERGITIINLPAYRPELKGSVEKFFDVIQSLFKPHLKGKGIIEPDFQERGAHDYRKDACLTLCQFEMILLRCILYYNSKRTLEYFPYSQKMITDKVQPTASKIWNYGIEQGTADLISLTKEELILTLLPRTEGKFTRSGLKVNKLRYRHNNYTEMYLRGGLAIVAYNPDNVNCVWLVEAGKYILFELIESRYEGYTLEQVELQRTEQKQLVKASEKQNKQAKIDLIEHIETIADGAMRPHEITLDGVREHRKIERHRQHKNFIDEVE